MGRWLVLLLLCTQAGAADLTKLTIQQVCNLVRKGDTAALEELVRRKMYPVNEVAYIARGEIFVGMSEGSAYCATGPAEKINTTETRRGKSLQVILKDGRYVYIDNGVVTAIQY